MQTSAGQRAMVDLDDTIIEVHGYQTQGAGFGYSGVRGLNALLVTASSSAPVILAQRLRQGRTGSPRGAARIVADALATLRRTGTTGNARPLLRADSAFYGHATIGTALRAGANVSVTVRMDPAVNATSATSALEIQSPMVSSRIASVYSITVHASSATVAIAALSCPCLCEVGETGGAGAAGSEQTSA